ARGEPGAGGRDDRDALQESRWRLGAVAGRRRRTGGVRGCDAGTDAMGRPARGARAPGRDRRREHGHRAGRRLVARAALVAAMVAARRIALVAALAAGCRRQATVVTPPPPEVSVSRPVAEPVQETLEFTGRTKAVDRVEVRARVTGYITKVAFA